MDNNRELHNILYNNHYFLIKISEGAVLPENHPNYYDEIQLIFGIFWK